MFDHDELFKQIGLVQTDNSKQDVKTLFLQQ